MENISSRTTSSAKSRSACSARRTFLNSFSVAEERELVLGLADDAAGPGQQHARLAEQVERDVGDRGLLFELGQAGHPLLQPVAVDQRVVAEGEAVADQRAGVEAVGDGGVDAFERVGEPGAERPAVTLVVVLGEQVVRVVVESSAGAHVSDAPHMWGTSSGMS